MVHAKLVGNSCGTWTASCIRQSRGILHLDGGEALESQQWVNKFRLHHMPLLCIFRWNLKHFPEFFPCWRNGLLTGWRWETSARLGLAPRSLSTTTPWKVWNQNFWRIPYNSSTMASKSQVWKDPTATTWELILFSASIQREETICTKWDIHSQSASRYGLTLLQHWSLGMVQTCQLIGPSHGRSWLCFRYDGHDFFDLYRVSERWLCFRIGLWLICVPTLWPIGHNSAILGPTQRWIQDPMNLPWNESRNTNEKPVFPTLKTSDHRVPSKEKVFVVPLNGDDVAYTAGFL